jgi:Post-segregation antitoxin CcdA
MRRVNVSLPEDLHDRAKEAGLNVSAVCAEALEGALQRRLHQPAGAAPWDGTAVVSWHGRAEQIRHRRAVAILIGLCLATIIMVTLAIITTPAELTCFPGGRCPG